MKKVLIVDDEPELIEILGEFLAEEDIQFESATSVEEAKTQFANSDFAAIITDNRMNGESGLDLIHYIRVELKLSLPIFLISGAIPKIDENSPEYKNVQFIKKPFSYPEFASQIRENI